MRMRFWALALVLGTALCALADPGFYAKRDGWRETLVAAREGLVKSEEEAARNPKPAPQEALVLGTWYRIGPFAEKGTCTFADAAPPETEIALDKVYGADKLAWVKSDYADGEVHDLPGKDAANTYLYRTITAQKAITLTGYFGSDDGLVVWFNGEKLLSQDVPRGAGANQASAPLKIKAGENKLLLKIHNNTGGHGFYFNLQATPKQADPKVEARNQLWSLVERDFGDEASRRQMTWERAEGIWNADWAAGDLKALANRYLNAIKIAHLATEAKRLAAAVKAPADLVPLAALYEKSQLITQGIAGMKAFDSASLRRALDDLNATYGAAQYPKGKEYAARLDALEKAREAAIEGAQKGEAAAVEGAAKTAADLETLRRDVLLSNPLVASLDKLVFVKRRTNNLGLPQNWQGNTSVARTGYENEIDQLSLRDGSVTTVYKPEGGRYVGNLYMHWDAQRMLFSMPNADNRWQIFEIKPDGQGLREVGPNDEPDVDNYDACYLPSGKIIFCSTRVFHGVPCVGGADAVGNLCVMDNDGKNVRMLCFDQDHNWCPTVLNDGRVMYTRWEYSDTAHYFTRILFKMNPDGTRQMEMYGSNSFWPNSMFYTRAIPGDPTKVVTIVSGHHGVPRMGEMAVIDPSQGRRETGGAVQLITQYGKPVENKVEDQLVNNSWPKFLHPYPLSDKYFLVASQPTPQSNWGLYLVDTWNNMLLLREEPGYALFEPVAVVQRPVPPVIPEAVKPERKDASVYVADLYKGPGLAGVPRGTIKQIRLYTPYYSYNNMGGHINIGIEGPWDVRRILGTVPVNDDGSVAFNVPANTPISFQACDEKGRAVQIMRSWYTAMPGEVISCAGCHESQNDTIGNRPTTAAARRQPYDIAPWRGPLRGFSWVRDVQPQVIDKYCVGCHDGTTQTGGKVAMDLRGGKKGWGGFDQSYIALHPYVRRHGPEGDDHMLAPMDFFANTSELIQMLQKGHYNVQLDDEAWDRLYTWIDLNVPDHGTWAEHRQIPGNNIGDFHARRLAMRTKYAGNDDDPEVIPDLGLKPVEFVKPAPEPVGVTAPIQIKNWPLDADAARRAQVAAVAEIKSARPVAEGAEPTRRTVDLGGGRTMEFVLVPAGEFVMGSLDGTRDETPLSRVRIEKPFWMSVTEVTNEQYNAFDAKHDSRYIDMQHKDHTNPGYPANLPKQPVVRVSWDMANDFCSWLSRKSGALVQLPSEAQWEWACRAGSDQPFWFGGLDTDFGKAANMADQTIKLLAVDGVNPQPVANPNPIFQDFVPRERRFNDGKLIECEVGSYQPNAWGLCDMHGNVAEWTRSDYKPYPYVDNDGRNATKGGVLKAVRGGSWRDRPFRCTSAWRLGYYTYQPVWDVGFRVILEDNGGKPAVAMLPTR